MNRTALGWVGLLVAAPCLLAYPVGELVPFDMLGADIAGVTSNGQKVAGYYYPWGGVVVWTEADGLVTVDSDAEASAISDDGRIFGSKLDAGVGHELPCYWDADNTYHELPYLPYGQNSDNFFSNVWCCNSSGTVLGGMQWISGSTTTPVMWYQDGLGDWQILDLTPADNTRSGRVNAVSEDGTRFAGWSADADGNWIPTVWTVDANLEVTEETVAAPPDWVNGEISAISRNGLYMAGHMNGFGSLWTDNGATFEVAQPDNPSFWMSISSTAVSDGGLVVGVTRDFNSSEQYAHVYKPGMGFLRADDYLDRFGVIYPEDYQSASMLSWVSASGQLLMGHYFDTNWATKMFILKLPELGRVEGTVTLNGSFGSVEDVLVSAGGSGTHPDASGHYSLEIGAGSWDVSASLAGYLGETQPNVVVPEGGTVAGIHFSLDRIPDAGFIEGQLTQIYNWEPFTLATITADNGTSQYTTHGTVDGSYQLIVPAGTWDLHASQRNCYDVLIEDVLVTAEGTTTQDIEFMNTGTPAFTHLEFQVADPGSFDWTRVKIKLGDAAGSTQIDVWDSQYDGEVWTPGTYTVSVWAPGKQLWVQDSVVFRQNEITSLTIPLLDNLYPVRALTVDTDGSAHWQAPLPVEAYWQDHESFLPGLDVTANVRYWYTPLWPASHATTTDERAFAGDRSLLIDTVEGSAGDIYCDLGWPYPTSGTHVFEGMLFVPAGHCAHHGIIREGVWNASFALETFYRADGSLDLLLGGQVTTLAYPQDQWFQFRVVADLDNDQIRYEQDGVLLASGPYSLDAHTGEAALLSVGTFDLSAEARPGFEETGRLYLDNYTSYRTDGPGPASYTVSLDEQVVATGWPATTFPFQDLVPGQSYTAGVAAAYPWGASAPATATFIPLAPFGAPAHVGIDVVGGRTVLSWDPVANATGYVVYSSSQPFDGFSVDLDGSYSGTSWSAPLPGTRRFYQVRALRD